MNRPLVFASAALLVLAGLAGGRLLADEGEKAPADAAPAAEPAQATKEDKVKKLLRLQGGEALAKMTLEKMMDQFRDMPGLPEGFADKFCERADAKQMMELALPSYVKHLDDATLDATIAFYESPEGKKLAAKMPAIQMESMDAGIEWGQKLGAEVAAELAEGK